MLVSLSDLDVFRALACTLYEMLALRSVFQDTLDGTFPGPIPDVYR